MQQPPQMIPMMHSFPPTSITTEQIQKYLDENKKLILAILDNQNLGKLAECAQYQAQLQKNLMYLAAIADAQPQAPTMPPQMVPHPAMQQGGGYYMAQQAGLFPPRMPLQFGNPHQMQDSNQQLHQQVIQGQMGTMRPIGSNNGVHPSHSHHLESGPVALSAGSKRDNAEVGAGSSDGRGSDDGEEPK